MSTKNSIKKLTEDDVTTIRNGFITHLKTRHIKSIHDLWGESKAYAEKISIPMGGGYASWGTSISVRLLINKNHIRFRISLIDVN